MTSNENKIIILKNEEDYKKYINENYSKKINLEYKSDKFKKQLENVSAYSGNRYKTIRKILLNEDTSDLFEPAVNAAKETIIDLENYIKRHEIKNNIKLYRGISSNVFKDLKIEEIFEAKTFSSFTSDKDVAIGFVSNNLENSVIMKMIGKKGSQIAPALRRINTSGKMSMGFNNDECEFVMNKNSNFKIIAIKEKIKKTLIANWKYVEIEVEEI